MYKTSGLPPMDAGPHAWLPAMILEEAKTHIAVAKEATASPYTGPCAKRPLPRPEPSLRFVCMGIGQALAAGLARVDLKEDRIVWWNPAEQRFVPWSREYNELLIDYEHGRRRWADFVAGSRENLRASLDPRTRDS